MRIYGIYDLNEIKLDEKGTVPNRVQVLRVGNFKHPTYGKFAITPVILAEMKKNFDDKVRGIDTAFDYFHNSDKEASAWVDSLELTEDGNELWATVTWTPTAQKKLAERELRYFSPDFAFQWSDPESGKKFSNVLFGGGLTNRPFVKEMQAIVAAETDPVSEKIAKLIKEGYPQDQAVAIAKQMEQENKLAETKGKNKMTPEEMKAQCDALQKQIDELKAQLETANTDKEAMLAEKNKLAEKIKCAEAEAQFNILLSEGKACAAQKEAFVKGDMNEFIKLAQPLNMAAQGTGASKEETVTDANREDKILTLAEEKRKANSSLSVRDSIALAAKEIK